MFVLCDRLGEGQGSFEKSCSWSLTFLPSQVNSDPFKVIGQFSRDGTGLKTRVKFATSHWSVLIKETFEQKVMPDSTLLRLRVGAVLTREIHPCGVDLRVASNLLIISAVCNPILGF